MERLGDYELLCIFDKIRELRNKQSFCRASKKFMKVACIRLHSLRNSFPDLLYDILPESSNLVNFYCSKPLSNAHIKLLARSCPKLLHLWLNTDSGDERTSEYDFDDANTFSNLSEVNLSGIQCLVSSCKNLVFLDLSWCVNVTDQSLKAIGEATRLRNLVLQGCYLITDLGLKYLANGNEHIKNSLCILDLSECDRISDSGIIHLKQMVNLFILNLSKCGVNVTDDGIVALLSQLPNIAFLDLSWLINVTDISLLFIARECSKLEFFYLNGCATITGEGLRAFANHPNLHELNLHSCHNFSWDDVQSVILTCSRLTTIRISKRMNISMLDDYVDKINNCWISWK